VRRFVLLAGLTVGGLAWAANTQLGEILPYPECRTRIAWLAYASLAVGLVAIGAALISWRARKPGDVLVDVFLLRLGLMAGLLFAFAIALQGAASLVLTGCER
jgi:predicted permease